MLSVIIIRFVLLQNDTVIPRSLHFKGVKVGLGKKKGGAKITVRVELTEDGSTLESIIDEDRLKASTYVITATDERSPDVCLTISLSRLWGSVKFLICEIKAVTAGCRTLVNTPVSVT